jgi:hypothetical protein
VTTWTNRGKQRVADGTFDPDNLTMALLTTTPADATAVDWNTDADLVDEVDTGDVASYVRTALGTATITEDDTADEATIDYADVDFGALEAGATPSSTAAIDLTSDEVMWVAALTSPTATDGSNFTVVPPSGGLAAVT